MAVPSLAGMLLVFYNENVYLYNPTEGQLSMKQGQVLAQFYKGKWISGYTGEENTVNIPFKLKSSTDMIHIGNEPRMLKRVIEEMREKDHLKAKLAYHTLADTPALDDMAVFFCDRQTPARMEKRSWHSTRHRRPAH